MLGASLKQIKEKLKETAQEKKGLLKETRHLEGKYKHLKNKFTRWMQLHSGHELATQFSKAGGHKKISEDVFDTYRLRPNANNLGGFASVPGNIQNIVLQKIDVSSVKQSPGKFASPLSYPSTSVCFCVLLSSTVCVNTGRFKGIHGCVDLADQTQRFRNIHLDSVELEHLDDHKLVERKHVLCSVQGSFWECSLELSTHSVVTLHTCSPIPKHKISTRVFLPVGITLTPKKQITWAVCLWGCPDIECTCGYIYDQECGVNPAEPKEDPEGELALKKLLDFERLGWTKKEKLQKSEQKLAATMGLPIGAQKFKWMLPDKTKGEVTSKASTSTYDNKQNLANMEAADALKREKLECTQFMLTFPGARGAWGEGASRNFGERCACISTFSGYSRADRFLVPDA